jgi:uncharacterized protein (TIGR03435 family)
MRSQRFLCFVFFAAAAFGQNQARPRFEVCSVKPSPAQAMNEVSVGVRINGAQAHVSAVSMRDLIHIAFREEPQQIAGPAWLSSTRFDVDAKLPADATQADVPAMLRTMLEDRFALKAHKESREVAVYGLITAVPLKLKESPAEEEASGTPVEVTAGGSAAGTSFNLGHGASFSMSAKGMEGVKLDMDNFARTLSRFMDLPVVDMTGLKGRYDFSFPLASADYVSMQIRAGINAGLSLPAEAMRALALGNGDSLHSGLRDLGLRLERRKTTLEMLVVDSIEKTPTEN